MIGKTLEKWCDDYRNSYIKKKELIENTTSRMDEIQMKIDAIWEETDEDENIFNPNIDSSEQQRDLNELHNKKRVLEESLKEESINIEYLKGKIDELTMMIEEVYKLEASKQENISTDVMDKIKFISEIVEIDPRRSKVELQNILEKE